jgi:hypothetical protein
VRSAREFPGDGPLVARRHDLRHQRRHIRRCHADVVDGRSARPAGRLLLVQEQHDVAELDDVLVAEAPGSTAEVSTQNRL